MFSIKNFIIDNLILYKFYIKLKLATDKGISKNVIAKYIRKNPVILEIGAHVGSDTVEMAVKWPEGKIYAFEPIQKIFDRLKIKTKNFKNIKIIIIKT